jgi:hypothetical protein
MNMKMVLELSSQLKCVYERYSAIKKVQDIVDNDQINPLKKSKMYLTAEKSN